MNRAFFVNIVFLVLVNVLIKPFFIFGIDFDVQNLVGKEAYGTYFSLTSLSISLMILNDMGILQYNTREIAQNPQQLPHFFPNMLLLKGILGAIYLVALELIGFFIGYSWAELQMLFFTGIIQILITTINYQRGNIAGLGKYWLNSFTTVIDRFLLIIVCGVLLWLPSFRAQFTINWFIYAQVLTLIFALGIAFFFTFSDLKNIKFGFDHILLRKILRGSLPFAISLFLMAAYTRLDAVMLERMLPDGKEQSGIYASAYRLLEAVNMLGFLFAGLLLPIFSRMVQKNEPITSLLRFSYQIIWAAAWTIAVVTWFFRNQIMPLLSDEATLFSGDVLGLLMFSFVAVCTTYIYSTLINAVGQTSKMNWVFIIAILINIGLNLLLIPSMKAKGAAISTLITQSFVAVGIILLSSRLLILRGSLIWQIKLGVFVLLLILTNWILVNCFTINWIQSLFIVCGVSGILSLAFGFLNYKKIETSVK